MKITRTTDLSVIIVNWNTAELLKQCLGSVVEPLAEIKTEFIVVDNASSDDSVGVVKQGFPSVGLIENDRNVGFARANNQGIAVSHGRYILLLNSDTVVPSGLLDALVQFMEKHPEAGAMCPRLLRPDGTPQPFAFGRDPTLGYLLARGLNQLVFRRYLHDWATEKVEEVDWVSGACLLLRKDALDQTGLLDDRIFMYFEDNDICLRLRKCGWKVYYDPHVSITHIGGQSLTKNETARKAYYLSLEYFYKKHYGRLEQFLLRPGLWSYRRLGAR